MWRGIQSKVYVEEELILETPTDRRPCSRQDIQVRRYVHKWIAI